MADPITFTTEAERLKARELYVAIRCAINPDSLVPLVGQSFDAAFPPITPPKMVPFVLNAQVDNKGRCIELEYVYKSTAIDPKTTRETRVRVVEVDDE